MCFFFFFFLHVCLPAWLPRWLRRVRHTTPCCGECPYCGQYYEGVNKYAKHIKYVAHARMRREGPCSSALCTGAPVRDHGECVLLPPSASLFFLFLLPFLSFPFCGRPLLPVRARPPACPCSACHTEFETIERARREQEEAERKAREERERKQKEEDELAAAEEERRAAERAEEERLAELERQRLAAIEAKRQAEEAERLRKLEEERRAREAEEKRQREEVR